jgi:hypothetical protein
VDAEIFWFFPPTSLFPSLGLTKASVAAAPSKDKGEFLPVLIWDATTGTLGLNNCLAVVVVVVAVLLLLSFGSGGILPIMGGFRKFLLEVPLFVVEIADVFLAVADVGVGFFSPAGVVVFPTVDAEDVRFAVTATTLFSLLAMVAMSLSFFDKVGGDDSLVVCAGSIGTDNHLVVLALVPALVDVTLVSLETVDLIRRSKTWYRFRKWPRSRWGHNLAASSAHLGVD